MKKVISVLLCLVMMFSLATPAFASSISDKVDNLKSEISTNVKVTKKSIKKIIELSGKTAKKLEPVILEFVLDSDNWEKAAEVMMNVIIEIYEKIKDSIPEKPQPPVEPDDPDVPPVDPDDPDVPPVDPDDPDVPPVDPDDPDVPPVDPDEPDVPVEPEEPAVPSIIDVIKGLTIQDFVRIMQTYFIINMEDIDETSKDIIDYAEYKYVTTADGKKTVYIMVDIQKHPELLNRDLLMETVKGLYEKQNEEFNEDADILMSYEHIAGELALHAILYAVTNEYVSISGATEGTLYEYWVRTQQADLNFDESRIPTEIIEIVGTYIMGVFLVNFYTIFKIFK